MSDERCVSGGLCLSAGDIGVFSSGCRGGCSMFSFATLGVLTWSFFASVFFLLTASPYGSSVFPTGQASICGGVVGGRGTAVAAMTKKNADFV